MFIPQVALAILASAVGPWLARRLGLRGVLLLGLGADLLSMALLAASALLIGSSAAFALLCLATGALGFGFGATVMTLNTWVERLAADRADAAVLTLNALLGVGTALAPAVGGAVRAASAYGGRCRCVVAIFAAGLFLSFAASKPALGPASAAVAARRPSPAILALCSRCAALRHCRNAQRQLGDALSRHAALGTQCKRVLRLDRVLASWSRSAASPSQRQAAGSPRNGPM